MKYIDKSTNQITGMAIVNELLADSWDGSIYYGGDYDGLKKSKYKNRFTYLLLEKCRWATSRRASGTIYKP